jgi:hypothetical protein
MFADDFCLTLIPALKAKTLALTLSLAFWLDVRTMPNSAIRKIRGHEEFSVKISRSTFGVTICSCFAKPHGDETYQSLVISLVTPLSLWEKNQHLALTTKASQMA